MKNFKINTSWLRVKKDKKKKKKIGEIRQEVLKAVADKWKKRLKVEGGVGEKGTKDHPFYCSHEHCAYWRLKKLPGSKVKKCRNCGISLRKRKLEDEDEEEEED